MLVCQDDIRLLQVFLLSSVSCLLVFGLPSSLLPYFLLICIVQSLALLLCLRSLIWPSSSSNFVRCSNWFSWHLIGGVLVSLPIIVILLSLQEALKYVDGVYYFASIFFIGVLHFCNFTQLNCWMKSSVATVAGLVYLILMSNYFLTVDGSGVLLNNNSNPFQLKSSVLLPIANSITFQASMSHENDKNQSRPPLLGRNLQLNFNSTTYLNFENKSSFDKFLHKAQMESSDNSSLKYEIYLDVLLILLLVWFLNREFEISYRLSFHGNIVAARDKAKVQVMKDQAELLLHNIIPKHVAEHLKTTAK